MARRAAFCPGAAVVVALALAACWQPLAVKTAPSGADSTTIAVVVAPDSLTRTTPATPPTESRPRPMTRARGSAPTIAPSNTEALLRAVPPPLVREFRGVWVASVANIDWPSSRKLSTAQQQRELIELLERAVALKLNAVIFQVRPAADALYASKIEPWSEYLTGAQGRAPDPFWDPLAFAVREAHARNLELHAWFNPYRARFTDAKSPLAASHIANASPALVKEYAGYLWMDPGEPAVRDRTKRVVLDVVTRYDIDAVHLDDYFYPYPERDRRGRVIAFPDGPSWQRYRRTGGMLSLADWRRSNVDVLVRELHDGIHKTKPWVRFGVSPFGIWRPGFPAQVRGFDSYEGIFADARKWLREGWVDYFTPQLYWPTTRAAQAYPALLDWWVGENTQDRHLWPGNFTSRAGARGPSAFSVSELLEQIRVTRNQPGATGNVHFSMKSFLVNQGSMNDTLMAGPYAATALVPATPWLHVAAAALPVPSLGAGDNGRELLLHTAAGKPAPWQWVVQLRNGSRWTSVVLAGTTTAWTIPRTLSPDVISVTALNRAGEESASVVIVGPGVRPSPTTPAKRGREHED